MNRTLIDCGYKEEVETKSGRWFDVSAGLPKSVKLPNKQVRCKICNESFTAKKYLDTHVRLKHPFHDSRQRSTCSTKTSILSSNIERNVTQDTPPTEEARRTTCRYSTENENCEKVATNKTNNRRGSDQRRSYTVDFKIKTLELLEE